MSNASGFRSSPSPRIFLDAVTLMLSLGYESGTGAGIRAGSPAASPWSDISPEPLSLFELAGWPTGAANGALLGDPFKRESGNQQGVTVAAFTSSIADSTSSCCVLSLASCLAVSLIENFSLGDAYSVALTNGP